MKATYKEIPGLYESMNPMDRLKFSLMMMPFKISMSENDWDEWVSKMKMAKTEDELMGVVNLLPTL